MSNKELREKFIKSQTRKKGKREKTFVGEHSPEYYRKKQIDFKIKRYGVCRYPTD